jgi:ABC-2 type transport system permease protein
LFPQYTIKEPLKPFDWRWYFAFQHMGDVAASEISEAYRQTIRQRDEIAGAASWFSPALAIQRHLQRLARTDVTAQLDYDAAIRRYHAQLQAFYLPLVFSESEYDGALLKRAPAFQ